MKCQILFSWKNKKNIINLSSAENAKRVVKVNEYRLGTVNRNLFMGLKSGFVGVKLVYSFQGLVFICLFT